MDKLDTNTKHKISRFKKFMLQNDEVTPLRKVYSVFIAIGVGLLLGFIPIEAVNGDSILAYEALFTNFANSQGLLDQFFNRVAVYGLLALGTAIAFKAGVLNIGATGQFLAGGCLTLILGIEFGDQLNQSEAIVTMFFISTISGACVALIAGFLKVYLRINEVVTTLLLNWVVYYIFKIVLFDLPDYKDPNGPFSLGVGESFSFFLGDDKILLPLLLFGGSVVIIFFIFTFTTFGLKIKACGKGFAAAKANGVNVNQISLATFAISGALGGLAGALFYANREKINLGGSSLPIEGFNAIAIALLAYNQSLGIVFTSTFYSILEIGKPATNIAGIAPEAMSLVLAIIIFFSALASIFIKARPLKWLIEQILSRNNKEYKELKDKFSTLKEKRDNNKVYWDAKRRIKHINNVLQDRERVKEKMFIAREDGGVQGTVFQSTFEENHKVLIKRKQMWLKHVQEIDDDIAHIKVEMKLNRVSYIEKWYSSLGSFNLFLMRFIA